MSFLKFPKAKIVNGQSIASDIRAKLKEEIEKFIKNKSRKPRLEIVVVGSDPATHRCVQLKEEVAKDVKIETFTTKFPSNVTEEELVKLIKEFNENDQADGILVQLPLPEHIDENKIANTISPNKDVDGFNQINAGKLFLGMKTIIPSAALAVKEILLRMEIPTYGKNITVVGTSKNFGLPIGLLMHNDTTTSDDVCSGMSGTVSLCNKNTPPEELKRHCKKADIIISVVGKKGLIKSDMVKEGACIIDVGFNPVQDESGNMKFVGDVDFEEVEKIAGCITPVPGGVGPVTIAMLMRNVFEVAKNK